MARTVKQPDIRREEFLEIGTDLYFKLGEKGVSIQKIVQQANVATGLFYYYFKSKDEFLDEALNAYINKETSVFEDLLKDDELKAVEKLDAVFDAYFDYVKKMAPYRSSKAFHTQRHYALTEKLTEKLSNEVGEVIRQGALEKIFNVSNIELTSRFIVGGLLSLFEKNAVVNENSLNELKTFVNMLLKGNER